MATFHVILTNGSTLKIESDRWDTTTIFRNTDYFVFSSGDSFKIKQSVPITEEDFPKFDAMILQSAVVSISRPTKVIDSKSVDTKD